MFTVRLVALVAGNPLKAWAGSTGPGDEEHVPDDEWADKTRDFESLEDAKAFIGSLHSDATTHVELWDDDTVLYRQDAGDDLDVAGPGVEPLSEQQAESTEVVVPEGPPVWED